MLRRTSRGLGLLVAFFALAAPTRANDGVMVMRSEAVPLESALAAQRGDLANVHPLPDVLRIGEHEFLLKRLRGTLTVAIAPGKPPSKRLREDKVLDLRVPVGKGKRQIAVQFRKIQDDDWEYAIAEARRLSVDDVAFELIDANADGRIDTDGADAYRCQGASLVLPLTDEIIVGANRVTFVDIAPDGEDVSVRITPIEGEPDQLAALALVNAIRGNSGLPGVTLDAELSADCTAHAAYLKANRWSGYTNPHGEVEGKPGYSAAGHAAAQRGIIMGADHRTALGAFFVSYYHRAPLISPYLERVGISTGAPQISVIDAKTGQRERAPDDAWNDPVLVPADGANGFPTAFCQSGEQPEPCGSPASRGNPLMVLFSSHDHGVTEFRGELVRINGDKEKSVAVLAPRDLERTNMFGVIPERPLAGGATYRVTYRYLQNGDDRTLSATFETR